MPRRGRSGRRSPTRSSPAARDPRRRALVLVAIRADFYGRCASYPELWRLLGANQVTVGPMRRDELRRAIELPAPRAGLQVEPELADALITDVEGEPGALPLMSTALLELWQRRDGRRLRMTAYEQVGGVDGAVARLAETHMGAAGAARSARSRAASCCGSRATARATRSYAGTWRFDELAGRGRRRGARHARRRPPGDRQRGRRSRSRTRRCCASGRDCAAGSRKTRRGGACTSSWPSPRANGTPAAAIPASSTAAPGWRERWSGPRRHEAELNATERAFLDREPRCERALPAPAARGPRRCRRAARPRGRSPGVVALRPARQRARGGDGRGRSTAGRPRPGGE